MNISVIIPMYNAQDSITAVLESLRKQSYTDFEIIIVNDGSTDRSKQTVEIYMQEHPDLNIKLVDQINKGVSAARNAGMHKATGQWLCLLDSDDEWLPVKLERQLSVIQQNPEVDFLGTSREGEILSDYFFKKINHLTKIEPKDLLYKVFFITSTVMFKRDILNDVGDFDEKQSYCEDANYFIRIAEKKSCYLLNEGLILFGRKKKFFGESGLSSNLWAMQKGELTNLKYALKHHIVNRFEYNFIYLYSMAKYLRRVLNVTRSRIKYARS